MVWALSDGSVAKYAGLSVDLDGYPRAYHPDNYAGGAVESLCNAGTVHLPAQQPFSGARDCKRFMVEYAKIRAAGWKDPAVGAVSWYGIVSRDSVVIDGRTIRNVVPMLQTNGSGFFASPTALSDNSPKAHPGKRSVADQSRYVDASRVAYAPVPAHLTGNGFKVGTFGVAFNTRTRLAVPFVVGDVSPGIGEGSAALARRASGLSTAVALTRDSRYAGAVSADEVLWVFFGGPPATYDSSAPEKLEAAARDAFVAWGGDERLQACVATVSRPKSPQS